MIRTPTKTKEHRATNVHETVRARAHTKQTNSTNAMPLLLAGIAGLLTYNLWSNEPELEDTIEDEYEDEDFEDEDSLESEPILKDSDDIHPVDYPTIQDEIASIDSYDKGRQDLQSIVGGVVQTSTWQGNQSFYTLDANQRIKLWKHDCKLVNANLPERTTWYGFKIKPYDGEDFPIQALWGAKDYVGKYLGIDPNTILSKGKTLYLSKYWKEKFQHQYVSTGIAEEDSYMKYDFEVKEG